MGLFSMPKGTAAKVGAQKTAAKVKKPISKASHKVYNHPRFFRPTTKTQTRSPKLMRRLNRWVSLEDGSDPHKVILFPITSDKTTQKMENENTLIFIVATSANKATIAQVFAKLHDVKVRSVNTLIRPDGKKKAYIRLASGSDSLKVASKIGIL